VADARFPASDVRVETGIESGSIVTSHYDSMLAKLIAHADTRAGAIDRLAHALDETSIFGITTNRAFLGRLLGLPATRAATFHTHLIDEELHQLVDQVHRLDHEALALGACFWIMRQRQPRSGNPWRSSAMTGWQMTAGDDELSPIPLLHLESEG